MYILCFFLITLLVTQSYFKDLFSASFFYYLVRFVCLLLLFLVLLINKRLVPAGAPRAHVTKKPEALDLLLIVRLVACLNVLFGHWLLVVFAEPHPPENVREGIFYSVFAGSPWAGVWLFFTLSSYLIFKGMISGRHDSTAAGILKFYQFRLSKILPVYSLIVILYLLTHGYYLFSAEAIMATVFFDQTNTGVIGALWSISTEMQFYLCAPFLYWAYKRYFNFLRLLIFICIFFPFFLYYKFSLLSQYPTLWHNKIYMPFISNIDCFLVGLLVAVFVSRSEPFKAPFQWKLTFLALAACVAQSAIGVWSFNEMASYEGFPGSATRIFFLTFAPTTVSLIAGLFIYIIELFPPMQVPPSGLLSRLAQAGSLTYCAYVVHEPVYALLRAQIEGPVTLYLSLLCLPSGLFFTYLFASFLHEYIEVPCERLFRRSFYFRLPTKFL